MMQDARIKYPMQLDYVNATGTPSDTFTADGRLKQMHLGNGRWETHDYRTPGTATSYMLGTTQGNNNLTQLSYNFSATQNNGNVQSQTMMRNGSSWSQSYENPWTPINWQQR
jgi:hypothetical protein